MPDLEKVINSIKGCLNIDGYCNDCAYDGCVFEYGWCKKDLLADALTLLKEKEPRVMTLDEIKEYSKVAYMNRDPIWIEIRDPNGEVSMFGSFHLIESYVCEGEKDPIVRYWTARPTMEQRLAVKWNA